MTNKKTVAIGLDTHLFDYPWITGVDCDQHRGACFFVKVREILEEAEIDLSPGQEVIEGLMDGSLNADDVYLLQFEQSVTGEELLALGVAPSLLINLESPVFATDLYLNLRSASLAYNHCLGLWSPLPRENVGHNMLSARFPSYSDEERLTRASNQPLFANIPSFEEKKLASMVVANKYWRRIGAKHVPRNLVKSLLIGSQPGKRHQIRRQSLHDTRLRLISFFLQRNLVEVWGGEWDGRPLPFPFNLNQALRKFRTVPTPHSRDGKLKIMSNYRFGLVTENIRYPGYVTEKIFDAFISGTVPVYWGAPDIEKFVPPDCFIDGSKFKKLSELAEFMQNMTAAEHQALVRSGENFLSSAAGHAHTFEAFGEEVSRLLLSGIPHPKNA